MPVSAARLVLPAIVPPFLAAYPDIRLEVIAEDSFVDVLAAGCDAGIRYDERLEQDMIAVPIGPRMQRFATAAARPISIATAGQSIRATCSTIACLRGRFPSGAMTAWEFERDGEVVQVDPTGPLIVSVGGATDLAVDAAVAGTGIMRCSKTGCARTSTAARWSRCSSRGGSASPGRSSTIPDAAWCRRRCGPSSISSRHRRTRKLCR